MNLRSVLASAILGAAALFTPFASPAEAQGRDGVPHWQQASAWPDRVIVTLPGDPRSSFAVTWRTDTSVETAEAEIVLATPDARFDLGADSVAAATQFMDPSRVHRLGEEVTVGWNANLPPVHYHSVQFEGLEPDTLYAYRVRGGGNAWSEWYHVRTAPVSGPVSFIYMGDAQNGIRSHWARTMRASFQTAPHARFVLHAGDLVGRGARDGDWAAWFDALGFIHAMIPAIPVAGNHEYDRIGLPDDADRVLGMLWPPQFSLPEDSSLPEILRDTVYAVSYNDDVDIFVLDTTAPHFDAQVAWLEAQLQQSRARWRILSMHHPVFSSGGNRDNPEIREALLPILLEHGVELVLQGHDHTYARGQIEQGGTGGLATVFVTSVGGHKQYVFKEDLWEEYASYGVELARHAENTQMYHVIDIEGDTLRFTSYTVTGELYDSFTLNRTDGRGALIIEGPGHEGEARRFANTLPYPRLADRE